MDDQDQRRPLCVVCQDRLAEGVIMCRKCGRSFDKVKGQTVGDVIEWAANRARTAERRRWGRFEDRRPRRTKAKPAPKKRPAKSAESGGETAKWVDAIRRMGTDPGGLTKPVESAMSMASLERMIGESGLRPGGFITGTVEEIMEAAGDPLAWGSDD